MGDARNVLPSSPLEQAVEQTYALTIFLTIVGFAALAAFLLIPVHRFLIREQKKGEAWNAEIRRRQAPRSEEETPQQSSEPTGRPL